MESSGVRFILIGSVALAVLMTVFRPRGYEPTNSNATEITLSFWGSYEEWGMWRDIVEGFQAKNPDVWVRMNYIPGNYDDVIQLRLAADTAPDVMLIQDEPFPKYAGYGKFADLTDWAYGPEAPVNWDADFWPTAAESFRYRGRVMGVPIWGGNVLVYYNRKMFRDLGVEPPSDDWTFDTFIEKAKELTRDLNGDGRLDTFGFSLPGWIYFLPWTWGFGVDYLNESRTDWAFTGPQAVAATAFYQNLRYSYHVSPSIQDLPGADEAVMFMTGRVGMMVSGPWNSPPLKTAGIDFDVVHIPVGPVGQRFTRVTWDSLCLFSKSAHKEEALRFIAYCISPEAQTIVGHYIRSVPALIAAKGAFMNPDNGWSEEKFIEALSYARLQPISAHWNEINQLMQAEYDLLLLNKIGPEVAVENMAQAMYREKVFPIEVPQ